MFSIKGNCRQLKSVIRRGISKTTINNNSYAMSRAPDSKMQNTNLKLISDINISNRRWMEQMQPNDTSTLSTIPPSLVEHLQSITLTSKEQYSDFLAMFPDIIRELTDVGTSQELSDVMSRFAKVLEYHAPTDLKLCGMIIISAYNLLEDPQKLTPENIKLASILGWCVEMIQMSLFMIDDIMDCSETRWGKLCWYRQPKIGLSALNDAIMIEYAAYILLKKYFRDHPAYVPLLDLFHGGVYKLTFGQSLDAMVTEPSGKPKLELFTMDRYTSTVKYKTTSSIFHLPIAVTMCLVGMCDEEKLKQAETTILEMGHYYQVQNDFLDCFGDPAVTGKIGTDIELGKCSWLAVMALQKAAPAQRKVMEEHYGRAEPESIATIRRLYEDLCLPNLYADYEEKSFQISKMHIQQIPEGSLHDLLLKMMRQIYNRDC